MALPKATILSLSRETLLSIYQFVIGDTNLRNFAHPLLSLARTSHFLSEAALDLIWCTLPSIWPLLLLLPEDAWELRELPPPKISPSRLSLDLPQVEFAFRRDPRSTDFNRWLKYAPRVHSIDPLTQPLLALDQVFAPNVPDLLQAHCPRPALPNLRSLSYSEWAFSQSEDGEYREALPARFHFSPRLKTLWLRVLTNSAPGHLQNVIKSLLLLSPKIESLSLGTNEYFTMSRRCEPLMLNGVETCRLSSLTAFSAKRGISVAFDALLSLGRLPRLREVEIRPQTKQTDWGAHGRRDGFFAALEQLELDGSVGNHECCIAFLGAITPTSLRSVTFILQWRGVGAVAAESHFTAISTALGSLPRPSSVTGITIGLGDSHNPDNNIYHAACLAPLLTLRGLKHISVHGNSKVVPDDALLEGMSRAWPAISTIDIGWPRPPSRAYWDYDEEYIPPAHDAPDRPRATLAGLVHLVRRCAHLEHLAIAVDMRVVPDLSGRQGRSPPVFVGLAPEKWCKVRTLDAEGSVPGEPWAVASVLSLLFPRLEFIQGHAASDNWHDILRLHRRLMLVRWQERSWARAHGKTFKTPVDL